MGIFNKALHTLNNQRLIRIREKLLDFSFTVTWVPGKTHYIADALSRYPVFGPHELELPIDDIATCFRVNGLMTLDDILASVDKDYATLISFVQGHQRFNSTEQTHIAKLYRNVMNDLSIREINGVDVVMLQGTRIVVPSSARKRVIRELHHAHSGLTKSFLTVQQLYYWPGMRSDIKSFIDACVPCQEARPSLARQKLLPPALPSEAIQPMRCVALDLFSAAGSDWLAMVDRYSGYAWAAKLTNTTTRHVLSHLKTWFTDFGWPLFVRSDNGPQFRSEFSYFCKAHGITHELSSPYNPESNGLGEAAVKNMKSLVLHSKSTGENFHHALAAWRNMTRQDGTSPAQLFFGRRQQLGCLCSPN